MSKFYNETAYIGSCISICCGENLRGPCVDVLPPLLFHLANIVHRAYGQATRHDDIIGSPESIALDLKEHLNAQ